MSKRLSLAAVAIVGLVGAATFSVAQSPLGKTPSSSPRSRLTSPQDSPGLESTRAALGSSVLPGSASPDGLGSAGKIIRIEHALVTSLDPIKLPARDAGAIQSITVKKGNEVKENDILGQLDDRDSLTKKKIAELERDAAKVQAESDAQIKAAQDGAKVTEENYRANEKLKNERPGSLSDFDFRRSWFEWQRALAQIAVAEVEKSVAQATMLAKEGQIEGSENEIERRKIVAPIDGIITEIYKHRGEWCQPGDPILEIVRMDRVEIEGFVYAADASPSAIVGKPVEIVVQLAGGDTYKTSGTVSFASPVLEGSGRIRQFRVSTEIDNKKVGQYWVIQPGTEAEMVIDLSPPAPQPVVAPKTGSPARSRPSLPGSKFEVQRPAVPDLKGDSKGKTDVQTRLDDQPTGDKKSDRKTDSKTETKSDLSAKSTATKNESPQPEPIKTGKVKPASSDGQSKSPDSEKKSKPADDNDRTKSSKVKL